MRLRPALGTLAAAASVAAVIGYAASALSADHQDGPATTSEPPADINDVYTWMDGANVVLAMTVYPAAPTGAQFSDNVQYVFHTASGGTGLGATAAPVDVIATFDATQKIKLWVGTNEYVTGDASPTSGLTSADGKVKVFAGLRADPFFFNLDGFKQTALDVQAAAGSLSFNEAGCPTLDKGTSTTLVTQLATAADGGAPVDHFATFNGLAIVISVDKTLLTTNGAYMSVWGGTYATGPIGDAGGQ
ncbi:MAG TPA: DUF4331 family protein [Polyangiaceae bacterium]|jgi:hypothetical protein